MITEVRYKIYSLGSVVTGLNGKFYFMEAPQSTPKPYAVFREYAGNQARDTASKFIEVYFQINHYSDNQNELEAIAKASKEKFEDSESSWNLVEYHVDRIEFLNPRDGNGMITHQYKLELTKL